MLIKSQLKLRKYKVKMAIMTIVMFGAASSASANSLNAGTVLKQMEPQERHGYLAGVVEGLAYSRWLKDQPDDSGMNCIYAWFYDGGEGNARKLNTWLERHPDKPVGALMHVLIKKDCGE